MELTISELAEKFNLSENTIERWIRQGRIPVKKTGKYCTFHPSFLERWAKEHNLKVPSPEKEKVADANAKPSLSRIIKNGGVLYNVCGEDKAAIINAAVSKISGIPDDVKPDLVQKIIERENIASTGIGKGVAIPHPRTPFSNVLQTGLITTVFPEKPIDFDAIDGRPVFVMFIILSASLELHLHYLSSLSYILREDSFNAFLKSIPDPEAFYGKISEYENKITGSEISTFN